jgi:hypothetical protein
LRRRSGRGGAGVGAGSLGHENSKVNGLLVE